MYWDSGTTSSMDRQTSDLDGLFAEDNVEPVSKHTPPGVALPQLCQICDVQIVSKTALVAHMKHFHPGERLYPCNLCKSRFNNEADLGCHTTNVHSTKRLHCKTCSYCVVNRSQMRAHVKCHSLGLKCKKCNKCYLTK